MVFSISTFWLVPPKTALCYPHKAKNKAKFLSHAGYATLLFVNHFVFAIQEFLLSHVPIGVFNNVSRQIIHIANRIVTKKPSCFLVRTHSCQEIPVNSLCHKEFTGIYFPIRVICLFHILGRFSLFVGRFVGKFCTYSLQMWAIEINNQFIRCSQIFSAY